MKSKNVHRIAGVYLPCIYLPPHLLCHLVLNVPLDPAQHEGFEDHVESGELLLVQGGLLLCMALNVPREPLVEFFMGVKHGWHDEVQQGPQLSEVRVG